MHTVYSWRNKTRWFHAFSWNLSDARTRQNLATTVYRKPTHKEQYWHWDSHHDIAAKYSIINTLTHRAKTVCSTPQLLLKEEVFLREALQKCMYPIWALNKAKVKSNMHKRPNNTKNSSTNKEQNYTHSGACIKGIIESLRNICSKHGIQVHFKGGRTIKDLMVAPKDRDTIIQKGWVIYRYKC